MTPHMLHDDPPPAPPVDDDIEDNFGGWRRPLPTCVNHPGRETAGMFGDEGYCAECVGPEIARRRLWLKSLSLVQGGAPWLR